LGAKFQAFGWHVQEIDGHDFAALIAALERARQTPMRPSVIIANTIKGKGVPFMENVAQWHGSVKLTRAQAEESLAALGVSAGETKGLLDVVR
jgi:transketolase